MSELEAFLREMFPPPTRKAEKRPEPQPAWKPKYPGEEPPW